MLPRVQNLPFCPILSRLVDVVLIRSEHPGPGVAMSSTSMAFSCPQYSLIWLNMPYERETVVLTCWHQD